MILFFLLMVSIYILTPLAAYFLCLFLLEKLYPRLVKAKLVAHPEARSNHKKPTVTGGGLAIIGAALVFMYLTGFEPIILGLAAILCALSFYDDMRPLSAALRLIAQVAAVVGGLMVIGNIPFEAQLGELAYLLFALAWIWWINLTNFMDGIDEMSIQQHVTGLLGIAIILFAYDYFPETPAAPALILMASLAAFWGYNKHPARMFMGDAGSVPLGFLTGYFFIELMAMGEPFIALILPAYYVTDATSTLIKRILQGKNPAQAHSEHAYQHAVRSGKSHSAVSRRLGLLNLALVILAVTVLYHPEISWYALALAYAWASAACWYMRSLNKVKAAS